MNSSLVPFIISPEGNETIESCLNIFIAEGSDLGEIDTGIISDGSHSFDELYYHRGVLFSVICNIFSDIAWKSKLHEDGTMHDDMFIVGIETPEGQATYHYYNDMWDLFNVRVVDRAPAFDGHTPYEAIERIKSLSFLKI